MSSSTPPGEYEPARALAADEFGRTCARIVRPLVLCLLALACLSPDIVSSGVVRNLGRLRYAHVLLAAHTALLPGLLAHEESSPAAEIDACMAGNLASVHGEAKRAEALWSWVDGICQRIVPLGEGVTELRPTWFSGPLVERLNGGSLFFRRNTRVWQALYVTEPSEYLLTVRGQCRGPEPALMRVRVHASSHLLEFGEKPTEQSATISLVTGHNVLIAGFVNDSVSELGDRNLEILEISIERLSN